MLATREALFSQIGRAENGTDPHNVNHTEMHVDLFEPDDWVTRDIPKDFATNPDSRAPVCRLEPCPHEAQGLCEHRRFRKDELVTEMDRELSVFPGINFNFSQYIQDNVEEALSGVKGDNSVKIFGPDLTELERLADKLKNALRTVRGIENVGVFSIMGQTNLEFRIDLEKLPRTHGHMYRGVARK